MKKVEERNQIALQIDTNILRRSNPNRSLATDTWGDDLPIVRLGSEVGYVGRHGHVFESIEAAFVSTDVGCHCVASTTNVAEAASKIGLFMTLVALRRTPKEIAKIMFQGEMFMFETFSSDMERRRLVQHINAPMVDGYYPLQLTQEGVKGLRLCLESPMVDLPFDDESKDAVRQAIDHQGVMITVVSAPQPMLETVRQLPRPSAKDLRKAFKSYRKETKRPPRKPARRSGRQAELISDDNGIVTGAVAASGDHVV